MLEVVESERAARAISAEWNELVEKQSAVPRGLGPTSKLELATLALRLHEPDAQFRAFIEKGQGSISAILPCYRVIRSRGLFRWTEMGLLADLYPGRSGVIHDQGTPGSGRELLSAVIAPTGGWDTFMMTFVVGDALEREFLNIVSERKLHAYTLSETVCPYIELPERWEDYLARLGSRFASNLRSRERKLQSAGDVAIKSFTRLDECDEFFQGVTEVEKKSWKEAAGTSLTKNEVQLTYHKEMARICSEDGTFQGFLLTLNDTPIAHIIGLRSNGAFLNLKSSFVDSYRKLGLGTIIKSMVIRDVFDGRVRYWDFVGEAQEHKMQWTDRTYTLRKYVVFSSSLMGRLLRLRFEIAEKIRNLKARGGGGVRADGDTLGRQNSP